MYTNDEKGNQTLPPRLPKSKHFGFQDAEEEEEIPVRSSENNKY